MSPWIIGSAVAVFIALSVWIGLLIARYAKSDVQQLAILKVSFWFLTVSTCCYFWTLIVLFLFGHYSRSAVLVLMPFATLTCATIAMGLTISALREKIAFHALPDPHLSTRLAFKSRQKGITRIAARIMLLFALLQLENVALNYFTQLRTDADLAYKKILIDSRREAIQHSVMKLQSAAHSKSEASVVIRHTLAEVQQSLDGLKQFAQR